MNLVEVETTSLWRNRDYLLWWVGNAASSTGNQFALIAMPLMVLLLTGSPAQAGLVAGTEAVPFILLSLPVGGPPGIGQCC